mmetsp:Transcript_64925/g.146467  ORF Transcript_64925/g.146467 Transcript_64925/m.146467 type:complete len:207 (+) Transcript_64925:138-758(+)
MVLLGSIWVEKKASWAPWRNSGAHTIWKLRLCECRDGKLSYKRPVAKMRGGATVSIALAGAAIKRPGILPGSAPPSPFVLSVDSSEDQWKLCAADEDTLGQWEAALLAEVTLLDKPIPSGVQARDVHASGAGGASGAPDEVSAEEEAAYIGQPTERSNGGLNAPIPQVWGMGVDKVPTRYVVGCLGDEVEAARRWALTHAWRRGRE